jgi:antitoxin VapB
VYSVKKGGFFTVPLNIKNAEVEHLAAQLAQKTGESKTRVVLIALQERWLRLTGARSGPEVESALLAISERCSALPDVDSRSADEILGYGPTGTFDE